MAALAVTSAVILAADPDNKASADHKAASAADHKAASAADHKVASAADHKVASAADHKVASAGVKILVEYHHNVKLALVVVRVVILDNVQKDKNMILQLKNVLVLETIMASALQDKY